MIDKNILVDIYQSAAPAVGQRLFDDDILKDINYICEEIFQKRKKDVSYPKQEVQDYFEEFHTVISFFRHMEIQIQGAELNWEKFSNELIASFPQIAWTGASKEKKKNKVIYYFDFIPVAYREKTFPFTINYTLSLQQMYPDHKEELAKLFLEEIKELISKHLLKIDYFNSDTDEHLLLDETLKESANLIEVMETKVAKLQRELKKEQHKTEHLSIANEKLETLIEQMERYNASVAIKQFQKQVLGKSDDWHQMMSIDLKVYSLLLRKAKFLEQTWVKNHELIKESEKVTIQEKKLIYEREQIRSLKQEISTNEIYLLLDECKSIESRVKIRKGWWFVQPSVRIMKMDFDSLTNKASYFDLIQRENHLLEKISRG
ncbi:hypothetical protein [Enterococcus rivorum]|uniref:Uncharacterized protein n=1 Tax=Enterococcus rivorum TaxID=762845 RepID=A0A1E5KXH7_9ENTE|nr:hypothetical protein [Enterococcus rivorum]MBP2099476.1 hypothetical protein [Enterococcus rivorum]OEH82590.1 hypothetical protein BCR26_12665 [Enterococcus rivorum]